MHLYLGRQNGLSYCTDWMVKLSTVAHSTSIQSISESSIDNPIVDNKSYSYFLEVAIEPGGSKDLLLTNVRINYEYGSNLPLINK